MLKEIRKQLFMEHSTVKHIKKHGQGRVLVVECSEEKFVYYKHFAQNCNILLSRSNSVVGDTVRVIVTTGAETRFYFLTEDEWQKKQKKHSL